MTNNHKKSRAKVFFNFFWKKKEENLNIFHLRWTNKPYGVVKVEVNRWLKTPGPTYCCECYALLIQHISEVEILHVVLYYESTGPHFYILTALCHQYGITLTRWFLPVGRKPPSRTIGCNSTMWWLSHSTATQIPWSFLPSNQRENSFAFMSLSRLTRMIRKQHPLLLYRHNQIASILVWKHYCVW